MYTKLLAILIAGAALSGCCMSGTGCSTPTATGGAPLAWDGLGAPPTADGEEAALSKPKRRTARNRDREVIVGPLSDTAATRADAPKADAKARYDEWTRLPNEDPEADARLKRQIKICQNC